MSKPVKIILLVLGIGIVWVVLASINAGSLGLGVVLSLLALVDIVTGEFTGSNKMVWLVVCLMALLFALAGIGSVYIKVFNETGTNPVHILALVLSIVLPMAYFFIGRGQKIVRKP
jgi:glucan phosphoethanolaminetransferase (alkaline phosphatase superfamily)